MGIIQHHAGGLKLKRHENDGGQCLADLFSNNRYELEIVSVPRPVKERRPDSDVPEPDKVVLNYATCSELNEVATWDSLSECDTYDLYAALCGCENVTFPLHATPADRLRLIFLESFPTRRTNHATVRSRQTMIITPHQRWMLFCRSST